MAAGPGEVQRPVPADTKRLLRCVELGGGEVLPLQALALGQDLARDGNDDELGGAVRAGWACVSAWG